MKTLITDNGGEYKNGEVSEFLQYHDVKHLFTPAYTPASNGIVERHNGVLKMIFFKLLTSFRSLVHKGVLTISDVLLQAAAAKNSLVRRCGFSAQYLALGTNTFFDSIEEASPSQLSSMSGEAEIAQARVHLRREAQQMAVLVQSSRELR